MKNVPTDETNAGSKFERGIAYYRQREFEKGLKCLASALQESPNNSKILTLMASGEVALHGPCDKAIELLQQALTYSPNDSECANSLGALYWQTGRHQNAQESFKLAIKLNPEYVDPWVNLGTNYMSMENWGEADSCLRTALSIDQKRPDVLNKLANLNFKQGNTNSAINYISQAISLNPAGADYYANSATFFTAVGRYEEAIQAAEKSIELNPGHSDYHSSLANSFFAADRLEDAQKACAEAVRLNPTSYSAYNSLGLICFNNEDYDESLKLFEVANKIKPGVALILFNLACAHEKLGQFREAINYFAKTCQLDKNWKLAWFRLGNAWYFFDKLLPDALAPLDRAIGDGSHHKYLNAAYYSRALVHQHQGRWHEALQDFNMAIALFPSHSSAHFGRGMLLLKLAQYKQGWQDYEWRFSANQNHLDLSVDWATPEWDGQNFSGKTLLIQHEQGLGDALQYARFIPIVKAMGGRIVLRCGPPLFRLFDSIDGVDEKVSRLDPETLTETKFDYQVPLMTIAHRLGIEVNNIPYADGYLDVEPELVKSWADRLGEKNNFRVGLVWSGNPDQADNPNRSCALSDYASLATIPNVELYTLQLGPEAEQIKQLKDGEILIDHTKPLILYYQ